VLSIFGRVRDVSDPKKKYATPRRVDPYNNNDSVNHFNSCTETPHRDEFPYLKAQASP
jgi:hypothetical protein